MRALLMLGGAAVSAGALVFWLYLNALAGSWNTSNSKPTIDWLSGEALLYFWLPCALGVGLVLLGWRWKRR